MSRRLADGDPSEAELEEHFAAASGLLGLRAAPIEPGAHTPWDELRSDLEHGRRNAFSWSSTPERLRTIAHTVARFRVEHPSHWEATLVVFTPRRWPPALAAEMARGGRGGNLTGLLLVSATLRRLYDSLRADHPLCERTDGPGGLVAYAAAWAERTDVDYSSKRRVLDPLRAEAERTLGVAVGSYRKLRRARIDASRGSERAKLDEMRGSLGP